MSKIKLISTNLINDLITAIQSAQSIYILTSFVMDSGVKLIEEHLKKAVQRGAEVKLLAVVF